MSARRRIASLAAASLAALGLTALAAGPAHAQAPACDFSEIETLVEDLVATTPQVSGAALRLATRDAVLYEHYFGTFGPATAVPIASATKVFSAATLMTLVDDGLVDLDAPVSATLPAFTLGKGNMTLRQMFSHTSGLPGGSDHPVLADKTITLAQAVDQIACCIDLVAMPGTSFAYGGLSMHVGGRVAEVASGQLWDTLFAQRIAAPLGLTKTDYDAFGPTNNPRIAGGARSSLDDAGRLMEMLLGYGVFRGERVLSRAAVVEMEQDQTLGIFGPSYGLGVWRDVEGPAGEAQRVSSPGAFGFTPWLELDLGYYGVFMVLWSYAELLDEVTQIQALAREEIAACAPPAVAASSASGRAALVLALAAAGAAAAVARRRSRRCGADASHRQA